MLAGITDRYAGSPCSCRDCKAAGVDHLPTRRVPDRQNPGRSLILHGVALREWYVAYARFEAFAEVFSKKTGAREPGGSTSDMQPLRRREPGDDDE